jgi:hypothetical protein
MEFKEGDIVEVIDGTNYIGSAWYGARGVVVADFAYGTDVRVFYHKNPAYSNREVRFARRGLIKRELNILEKALYLEYFE